MKYGKVISRETKKTNYSFSFSYFFYMSFWKIDCESEQKSNRATCDLTLSWLASQNGCCFLRVVNGMWMSHFLYTFLAKRGQDRRQNRQNDFFYCGASIKLSWKWMECSVCSTVCVHLKNVISKFFFWEVSLEKQEESFKCLSTSYLWFTAVALLGKKRDMLAVCVMRDYLRQFYTNCYS